MKGAWVSLLFVFSTLQAFACLCTAPEPIDSAYNNASVVFVGKVKEIVEDKFYFHQGKGGKIILFDVTEGLKNSDASKGPVTLIDYDDFSCSFYFEEGKTYVIFAYDLYRDGIYRTDQCTRTASIEDFNLQYLSKLRLLSAKYMDNPYAMPGVVSLLAPEYNAIQNQLRQLEKRKITFKIIAVITTILLLVSVSTNIYLIRKK